MVADGVAAPRPAGLVEESGGGLVVVAEGVCDDGGRHLQDLLADRCGAGGGRGDAEVVELAGETVGVQRLARATAGEEPAGVSVGRGVHFVAAVDPGQEEFGERSCSERCDPQGRRQPGLPACWLLAEWPATEPEPVQFWLSNLPADTPLATLVRLAKLRWRIEHDYREMKQALGLAHFEGRTWNGWHHHVTLVTAAHAFCTLQRLARTPKEAACGGGSV
ncbi:transposase [Streptomyces sp. NPDC005408]|uniref:transposase n=1 Tax=Streptomyces sp. NPDC005408 TaxID=3155341 RepID=UPI0033ACAE27